MPAKLNLDVELIKDLYVNQKKSSPQIAKILGCSRSVIVNRLKKLNVIRTIKEARNTRLIGIKYGYKIKIDEEKLRKLYIEDELSTAEVAKEFGVNQTLIYRRLKDFGITIRPRLIALKLKPPANTFIFDEEESS